MPATTDQQKKAFAALGIKPANHVLLCLDGGGIRGMLTLQLLKQLEEVAGAPCHTFIDMVAGTSTGGIISGLVAAGKTAVEIEQLYREFVTKVFTKRNLLANRFVNPPAYTKEHYREALKSVLANMTLQEACAASSTDIMITSKDITDNEETFFTCFNVNNEWRGTYRDALLRTVMEATMSAPTYFNPLERFVDGGTTTYNNPTLAAVMEAIRYDGRGKYDASKLTVISIGTGLTVKSVPPEHALKPSGPDVYFWLNYVMDEASQDAGTMQVDLFRSGLLSGLDFRRYQVSFDERALALLPDRDISALHLGNAKWLRDLKDEMLSGIAMDDVTKFGLMEAIGQSMAEYIMQKNKFTRDLNDTPSGRDELVSAFSNIARIQAEVNNPEWIDGEVS